MLISMMSMLWRSNVQECDCRQQIVLHICSLLRGGTLILTEETEKRDCMARIIVLPLSESLSTLGGFADEGFILAHSFCLKLLFVRAFYLSNGNEIKTKSL